jgi:uncharacterized repeat protein (TIGR04138 family)
MSTDDVVARLEDLAESSDRFKTEAFLFVYRALEHCRKRLKRAGHVTGQELVESARQVAVEEYGPMAKSVLNHWGIESTEDIGTIVFLMVDNEFLSRTDDDTIEDFKDGFDFETEFVRNYPW